MLEIQWYLFAAVYLLGASYVFLRNEHVRIDALSHRWTRRTQVWIDVIGIVLFMLPLCGWVTSVSWPIVYNAYVSGEVSSNAGGLIRWPVYALMPLAFVLRDPGVNGVAGAFLLFSFYVNAATFLVYAILAEKHGLQTRSRGEKSLYFTAGLMEGTETILCFVALALWPGLFPVLAWIFGALCLLTAVARMALAARRFR